MEKRDRTFGTLFIVFSAIFVLFGTYQLANKDYISMAFDFASTLFFLAFYIVAEVESIVEFYSKKK